MSSDWKESTLGEFVRLQRGHDLTASEQKPGIVPVMGSAGQNGTHNQAKVSGPGLVIGRSGASIGRVHFSDIDFWPHNTCLYVTNFFGNNPRFAYYVLQTLNLASFNSGSAQPSLNRNYIYSIKLQAPPRSEQNKIVELLQGLDDRIALLRETNATLEAIAQAMFKSWFVDFDPVHAKAEGREPEGMDAATAALFPDIFEESEQRLVPTGWLFEALGSVAEIARTQIQPEAMTSDTLYVGLEHIPRKSIGLDRWGTAEELESAKSCFNKGDILFGKLRPYFHKVIIAPFPGICSTDILVCKPKIIEYHGFVTMHLFSSELVAYADRLSNGAKMPRVNWKDLAAYELVTPPVALAVAFDEVVQPMFEKIIANILKAQTLATLRDTLLPHLISGQLRLPDADAIIEEAAA